MIKPHLTWLLLPLAACAVPPDDAAVVVPEPVAVEATPLAAATPEAATSDVAAPDVDPDPDADAAPRDPSRDLTLITCGADKVLDLVGQPLTIALPRLPATRRIIRPADVVAQDYDTRRMNVFVGDQGVITRIDCG